jgi:hypothetical protein
MTHAEDGTFRAVAPFVPSGTYTLTVTASGLPVQRMPPIIFMPDVDKVSIRVPVAPDQDMPVGDIRLPAHAMYRLRVTVADGSGRTPDEAKVEVYLPPTRTTYTNREGRFGVKFGPRESVPWREPDGSYNFGPLPPGPVTVYAVNNRLNPQLTAMATVDVQPGALNEIHLELLPGARISGRVEFDGGTRPLWGAEPLRVRAVAAGQLRNNSRDPGLVAEDGTFQINGIVGRRCLRVDNIPGGGGREH